MGTIEENGFLSEDIAEEAKKYRKDNEEIFCVCEDINRLGQKTMLSLNVHNEHLPTILMALLLTRVISNFQGIILLAERGMINEAKILTRCALELMFAIVAIEKDNKFAFEIVKNDWFEKRKLLNAIIEDNCLGSQDIKIAKEELDKTIQEIKASNLKEISKRDMAIKAGFIHMYNSAYRMLSGTIHASVRSLNENIGIKGDKIHDFEWGPVYQGMNFILLTAAEALLHILEGAFQVFSIKERGELDSLLHRFKKTWGSFEKSEKNGNKQP
ncbi:MAG: DUF5677 domain-containing protein [Phycisphaerae bacterium]|jgi:hypothetical protein